MKSAVSTPYCQGPTIQTGTAFHQNTQPKHWLQPLVITYVNECAQSLMPRRLKLPIYFKLREKSFFTSITGQEYDPGKKPTKSEKLKTSTTKEDKSTEGHTDEPQPSQPPAAPEVDPDMPPLEDVDTPWKKFKFRNPESTVKPKHFQKK